MEEELCRGGGGGERKVHLWGHEKKEEVLTLSCRLICPFISKLQETTNSNRPIAFIDTCTCNRPYGSKTHPTQMMSRGIVHPGQTFGN